MSLSEETPQQKLPKIQISSQNTLENTLVNHQNSDQSNSQSLSLSVLNSKNKNRISKKEYTELIESRQQRSQAKKSKNAIGSLISGFGQNIIKTIGQKDGKEVTDSTNEFENLQIRVESLNQSNEVITQPIDPNLFTQDNTNTAAAKFNKLIKTVVDQPIEYVDDVFFSKAWLQLLGILIWIFSYVVDIALDLYFAFSDVLGKYVVDEEFKRKSDFYCSESSREEYLVNQLNKNVSINATVNSTSTNNVHAIKITKTELCQNLTLLEQLPDIPPDSSNYMFLGFPTILNTYSSLFWIALGSMFAAYITYTFGCIYIIYFTKLAAFEEYRVKMKNDPWHKWGFIFLLLIGIGPNYFLWNDLKEEWGYIEGETIWEKLKAKCLVWLDMYIHTLHLIHTMIEDIPLLYLYIYLSIMHYDDFIADSVWFYPTVISSLFFFIQDYSYWMLAVTTPEKTSGEATMVIVWTLGYLLMSLFTIVPVIICIIIIAGKFEEVHSFGDVGKTAADTLYPTLILIVFFSGVIIRFVGAVFMAWYKTAVAFKRMHEIEVKRLEKRNKSYRRGPNVNPQKVIQDELKLNQTQTTTEIAKGMTIKYSKKSWEFLFGFIRHLIVYLCGFLIYNIIPFSGGKVRTLLNSILFTVQYTIIYIIIGFGIGSGDEGDHKNELQAILAQVLNNQKDKMGKSFSKVSEKLAITIETPQVEVPMFIGCALFIVLSILLLALTISWFRHETRCQFLENDVDYLDRNQKGAPVYYDDVEYYTRHNEKYDEIGLKRNKTLYIRSLDHYDPLTKIEKTKGLQNIREKREKEKKEKDSEISIFSRITKTIRRPVEGIRSVRKSIRRSTRARTVSSRKTTNLSSNFRPSNQSSRSSYEEEPNITLAQRKTNNYIGHNTLVVPGEEEVASPISKRQTLKSLRERGTIVRSRKSVKNRKTDRDTKIKSNESVRLQNHVRPVRQATLQGESDSEDM